MVTVAVQWYQSYDTVTASLQLKPLPPHTNDDVTLSLEEQYCSILIADSVVWECHLTGRIVPTRSKLSLGKVRWEVKLWKADPIQWSEYEAEPPAQQPALEASSDPLPAGDSSPPLASLPSRAPGKPFVSEDLNYVTHLPHDWYETGDDVLTVKVTVGGVRGEGCRVEFREQSLELRFQTRDEKFLRSYPGTSATTTFVWNITLSALISPQSSSYSVQPDCVKLALRKAASTRWRALESTQHSKAISSGSEPFPPGPANQIQGNEQPSNQSPDDVDQNDLSAVSEVPSASACRAPDDANTVQRRQKSESYTAGQRSSSTSTKYGDPVTTPPAAGHTHQPALPGGGQSTKTPSAGHIHQPALPGGGQSTKTPLAGHIHQPALSGGGHSTKKPPAGHTHQSASPSGGQSTKTPPAGHIHQPALSREGYISKTPLVSHTHQTASPSGGQSTKTPPASHTHQPALSREGYISKTPLVSHTHQTASPSGGQSTKTPPASHTHQPALSREGYNTPTSSEYTKRTKHTPTSYVLPSELESSDPSYRYDQLHRPSLTGLCNLGNSCYMNSVIQCLSNTQELRDFFINGHYLADINKRNPLGFQGDLSKCFSVIVRKLWSGEYKYFPPTKLMSVIASKNSHFDERSQHDSHELMSYLLDGLHEDLNRIKDKPLTEPVEMEGAPDAEVADKSWQVHRLRNDSFFVDKFQGQFKSTLVCPVCSKVSVTFDPFMSLSVPIPENLRHLPVVFVPQNPDSMPRQYVLKLPPDANLELLKASVARKTGIPMIHLRVFEAYGGKFQTLMSHNQHPITSIKDNDIIIVSEVLSEKDAGGDVVEMNVIQRVQQPIFPTKCNSCGRQATEGKKLQRCSKCKAVGYCDRECQSLDWEGHKLQCRQGRPTPIGLPFVISLPATKFTYANVATFAEKFARRSVEYRRKDSTPKSQLLEESIQSNPEHLQRSTTGAQGSLVDILESATGVQGSSVDVQESTDSAQECAEGVTALRLSHWKPLYLLTPVDRYGDSIGGVAYLADEGEKLLSVDSQFLAMDWRNNPKDEDSVVVTPKPTMDFEGDGDGSSSTRGPITLEQCLELFTEPELLSKEEAWYCPRCKEHRQATKQMSVWRVPDLLIVHLKRFSFHTGSRYIWRDKIEKMVTFPLRGLDMSPYMLGDAAKLAPADSSPLYDLYAVVYHYGSGYIGHYFSSVKPPASNVLKKNEWLYYDDERVIKWPEDEVVNKEAYVLFYCRRDCSQHR